MTIQERIKSILLCRKFRWTSSRRLLMVAQEAGLLVDLMHRTEDLLLFSPIPTVLQGTDSLALGGAVVPQRIWIPLMELSKFLQATYGKVV